MTELNIAITVNATPKAVYQYLTDGDKLQVWFAEHAHVDIDTGEYAFWGRYTPGTPDRATGTHQITSAEAAKRLAFQWRIAETDTEVRIRLQAHGKHTRLYLQHRDVADGSHQPQAWTMEDFWFLSLENLRRAVDGRASDVRVDFSMSMLGNVEESVAIDAAPETVFDVLLRPEQLERWIASKADITPEIGGKFDLGWGAGPIKILDLVPDEKLAYAWDEGSVENPKPTVVTWTLEKSAGKTRLTFVHSGFADDDNTDGIQAGWRNFINWVRSAAEYGADWSPPVKQMPAEMYRYYAASMHEAAQHEYFQMA